MESVAEATDVQTRTRAVDPCIFSVTGATLKVRDIMSRELVTAGPMDTVLVAAKRMSENNISCVIVTDGGMVIGILTDKDILKGVAADDQDFHRLHIERRMSSPVEVVHPDESVMVAGKIMESKAIKRLPVVEAGELVGIVTQTDVTRGLISISPLAAVSEVMSTKVATVNTGAMAAEAARIMASHGISCLVAMHRQEVAGILTEKDLLRRVVALHKNPATTQVVEIMSFPLVSIPPSYSVLSAGRKMDTMRLHRLVVMDHPKNVCGIVTQTDIMKAVRNELERLERDHPHLRAELRNLIGQAAEDAV
ncbi:MAG: CBS domain-containing protein [Phycisphaerae bacterium]|nr:CBS domain-containing protein [Phycisphaerae bacterium]